MARFTPRTTEREMRSAWWVCPFVRLSRQRTLHKDRTGGDLFLFTHLTVKVYVFYVFISASHTLAVSCDLILFLSVNVNVLVPVRAKSRAQWCAREFCRKKLITLCRKVSSPIPRAPSHGAQGRTHVNAWFCVQRT